MVSALILGGAALTAHRAALKQQPCALKTATPPPGAFTRGGDQGGPWPQSQSANRMDRETIPIVVQSTFGQRTFSWPQATTCLGPDAAERAAWAFARVGDRAQVGRPDDRSPLSCVTMDNVFPLLHSVGNVHWTWTVR